MVVAELVSKNTEALFLAMSYLLNLSRAGLFDAKHCCPQAVSAVSDILVTDDISLYPYGENEDEAWIGGGNLNSPPPRVGSVHGSRKLITLYEELRNYWSSDVDCGTEA